MRLLMAIAAAALVGGCSTIDQPGGRLYEALKPADSYTQDVACSGPCEVQWQRAQLWLSKHSAWKVSQATDVVLQTFSPVGSDASYGFQITKEPTPQGGYVISMSLFCGNPLGCDPSPAGIRRAFNYYVSTGVDVLAGQGYLGSIR